MDQNELSHQYDPIADDFASVIEEGNKISREAFLDMLPALEGKAVSLAQGRYAIQNKARKVTDSEQHLHNIKKYLLLRRI